MSGPRLYERYERREAIDLLGSAGEAESVCDGQWTIFPLAVACFTTIGDPPQSSHFEKASSFCWVAERPYQVSDGELVQFVPREVIRRPADGRTIHLFVRRVDTERYWYVGELEPAGRFTLSGRDNCGEAYFRLSPALPSEVWIELEGLQPGSLDHAAIERALALLRHPLNVEERLWVLRQLIKYWHGPVRPEDGLIERELEGLAIPYPLQWWYRWAGRRTEIMSGQNQLLGPDGLYVADGLLVFYGENQWCYQWATLPDGDDPPVYGRESAHQPWEPEGITLSEHLILACLFEAVTCHSPYGAAASWLEEPVLNRIIEHIPPIPVNPWRWPEATRFYAKGGAFMYSAFNIEIDGKAGYSIWIGAKTDHPLQFLKSFIDEGWEYVAV
jgi:hypothetical protein